MRVLRVDPSEFTASGPFRGMSFRIPASGGGYGESFKEKESDQQGGGDICGSNGFVGVVAETAGRTQEEHSGGQARGQNHGVVTGSAGKLALGKPGGSDGLDKIVGELLVHGDGGLVDLRLPGEFDSAPRGDGLGLIKKLAEAAVARGVVGVSDIERELNVAGDDVGSVGVSFDFADGGDEAIGFLGVGFDGEGPLGGGGEGVVAEMHGGGSGVVGVADEGKGATSLADDGGDDAEAEVFGFKDWSLFDVDFEEGAGLRVEFGIFDGLWDRFREQVGAETADGLFEREAVAVGERKQGGIEAASDGAAAEKRSGEADAFLFRKSEDFKRDGQGSGLGETDEFKSEDDAKDAVEGTGVGYGVDVGTEGDTDGGREFGLPEAAEVAESVSVGGHAKRLHALAEVIVDESHRWSEEAARGLVGQFAEGGEESALGDELLGDGHGGG
uniref:Uncharacterized protein n=1 Tax=mine drainage metagenome TaxID=410659 RepID=E6QLB7_9ZZZZ